METNAYILRERVSKLEARVADLERRLGEAGNSGRPEQFRDGYRNAVRWCVSWIMERAAQMNDPSAAAALRCAADNMGQEAGRIRRAASVTAGGENG